MTEDVQPNPEPESQAAAPAAPQPAIVGIGASAGGLAALQTFFDNVPADTGLAWVVVVHLAPDHVSHLPELLQSHTRCPVRQVNETTQIAPDRIYVIPPNANLNAIDTHLRVSKIEEQRLRRAPIDHFFRTLAGVHDGHAVGVVLTGTGADGTLGIKDIKAKGGLVIVQDPHEAEYPGMPQSALGTGLADFVLPVAEIPEAILRYHKTAPKVLVPEEDQEVNPDERNALQKVFALIRARTDRDFSRYKRSTVMRRIARRMQLNYIEDLPRYLERLREDAAEVRALADDLLITVTSFFRDPEVWEKLETDVIPKLFDNKSATEPVRVWCVGCATGEEAYTIAMLLLEEASRRPVKPQIQLFASDLHRGAIDKAREGFYPGDIETDVAPERLRRFFEAEGGGFHVRKEVRDMVIFAPHNLLADPPFSRLDLVSCRNLLMYLERDVQRAVIELFHYALNPEGYLLLGPAEIIEVSDLFRAEDKKFCLYRKRNVPPPEPRLPVFPMTWARHLGERERAKAAGIEPFGYGSLHQRMVETYAPPSLLISPDNKLIHLSEHAGRYLLHPGGEPTANVFKLVREELRVELQALLQAARDGKKVVGSRPIMVQFNGHPIPVVMHVGPALEPEQEGFALVIFEEREAHTESEQTGDAGDAAKVADLERELELSRQRLRGVIEGYENSQEEMKVANEELQSANEELRSTMEELETSKEELQSINEELQTVNQENRHKVEELAQLSGDLQNLLSATDIAILYLDRELRIFRFTPKVKALFNLLTTDRGRPISDLTHSLIYPELRNDAQAALDRLTSTEREVKDRGGRCYLTRVLPYRGVSDRVEGVVITFLDITRQVEAEAGVRKSEQKLSEELGAAKRILDLMTELTLCRDLDKGLKLILDAVSDVTSAPMGTIQLLNPATNALEIEAWHGFGAELPEHFKAVAADPGSTGGRALRSGKRVVVEDIGSKDGPADAAGYRAEQSTPLVSREGRVMGMLSTQYKEPGAPAERDLRMLDLFAQQTAAFVERCRADEELRGVEERYRSLVEGKEG